VVVVIVVSNGEGDLGTVVTGCGWACMAGQVMGKCCVAGKHWLAVPRGGWWGVVATTLGGQKVGVMTKS
jgi:hypothetical protein